IGGNKTVDLVHRCTGAKRMGLPRAGDVEPTFQVRLICPLRRLRVGPAGKSRCAGEIKTDPGSRIEYARSLPCVHDVVGQPIVCKPNAVQGRSPGEIKTEAVARSVVGAL